jgi:glutaredoxin
MLAHPLSFRFHFLLLCVALFLAFPCSAQVTYRWITGAGETVYSDQPPPPGTEFEKIEGGGGDSSRALPYATRVVAEKYPVTLYTTANCKNACVNARDLLNGRGVPFSEKMITSAEEFAQVAKEMNNESFVPALKVGPQRFPGFEVGAWNNLLDLAGYPKTAPYGGKPSGAFSQ